MTVFIRDKRNGDIKRYPLIGNISTQGGRIVLAKDLRISSTVYSIPAGYNEIIRVTEGQLETPESVKAWAGDELQAKVDSYIETVFGSEV